MPEIDIFEMFGNLAKGIIDDEVKCVMKSVIKKNKIYPVFQEYITFLESKGIDLGLKEGYYWKENQIIKAYDIYGNIHKIARIYIDDELNIIAKRYNTEYFIIESWDDTVKRNIRKLEIMEQDSIKVINNALERYNEYVPIILDSSGKDSTVTKYLVRSINKNIKGIFHNSSLDCADTYKFIKSEDNTDILNPEEGFYQYVKRRNFIPNQLSRSCCEIYKEKQLLKHLDANKKYLFFMGMRNEESQTRAGYETEWISEQWGKRDWIGILPIREWSEEFVWLFIFWKSIKFNPKYRKGYKRVGCSIACPYYNKSTWVLDKYWYQKQFDKWHKIIENDFVSNFKWTRLNCTLKEYHLNWNHGVMREVPTDEVVREFAEYKGINIETARKYFSKHCEVCNSPVNKKDDIAMNLKLVNRNTEIFYCKEHLKEYLSIDEIQWNDYINDFKLMECSLF